MDGELCPWGPVSSCLVKYSFNLFMVLDSRISSSKPCHRSVHLCRKLYFLVVSGTEYLGISLYELLLLHTKRSSFLIVSPVVIALSTGI